MSSVSGFSEDALRFLVDLGSSDKAWFDEHRPACQSEIVAPAKAFVEARGEALTSGSYPLIQAQPRVNGSMAPINNDLRWRTAVDEHGEPLAAAISPYCRPNTTPTSQPTSTFIAGSSSTSADQIESGSVRGGSLPPVGRDPPENGWGGW